MAGRLVIDGRNFIDGDAVTAAGLIYEGIGRGDRPLGRQLEAAACRR